MNITEILQLSEEIQVMDVGAAVISETPIYSSLLLEKLAHLTAFDGDIRHYKCIKEKYAGQVTIYTDFLYDGSIQNIYLASSASGMTSLLKPNINTLKFFNGFENFELLFVDDGNRNSRSL